MQFERLYILNHSVVTLFTHILDSVNSPKSWERFVALLVNSVSVHPYLHPHQQKVLKCLIFIHICDGCGMQFLKVYTASTIANHHYWYCAGGGITRDRPAIGRQPTAE